ncbi:hypothetical protein RRG08_063931 [Elysia crispata]|uniref:Uncharacterized protein n=1 Tax=Elysia crispata TaxID=231223 RepID=A0AAE1CY15_9GAST|nr:hypothetical protein RRG08_063931 [Elysia crispata]
MESEQREGNQRSSSLMYLFHLRVTIAALVEWSVSALIDSIYGWDCLISQRARNDLVATATRCEELGLMVTWNMF